MYCPKSREHFVILLFLNYVEAGMMTVAELAERSGVGATTVMRLVKTLHYDSYSDFRRALLNVSLKNNASSYIGIKNSFQKASSNSDSDILHALWYDTTHTVENFITPKNIEQLDKAITLMMEASRINLAGTSALAYCIPVPGIGHRPLLSSCQAAQQRKRILV